MKVTVIRCDRCGADMEPGEAAPINKTIGGGLMDLVLQPAKDKDVCPACRKTVLGEALASIGAAHGLRMKRVDGPRLLGSRISFLRSSF